MKRDNVALITSGYFPVPAALGGAVEALDENLLKHNEIENKIHFTVFSCYNAQAAEDAKKYTNSSFVFVKIPKTIQLGDKIIYFIAKNILKKSKSMSYRYILQRLYYINEVAKNLHKNNYDKVVIENHSTLFMALKKYNNHEKYVNRIYYHLHNVVTNDYGCKKIIGKCKRVVGVSDYINRTLQDFLAESDQNKYVVLRNKIDKDKFLVNLTETEKCSLRRKYDISEKDTVFLFCGRFNEEKGIRELLEAFQFVNKNCKLLVVGGYYYGSGMISPFEQEMYSFVNNNLSDRVVFTGQVDYNMMPQLYAFVDVVVIPSIWDDPAPLTVIESLTSGKPLITTVSGGIPEYADSESSIILQRDEHLVDNLVKAMNRLADSEKLRSEMVEAVLLKTRDWDIASFYNDFCNIINDL